MVEGGFHFHLVNLFHWAGTENGAMMQGNIWGMGERINRHITTMSVSARASVQETHVRFDIVLKHIQCGMGLSKYGITLFYFFWALFFYFIFNFEMRTQHRLLDDRIFPFCELNTWYRLQFASFNSEFVPQLIPFAHTFHFIICCCCFSFSFPSFYFQIPDAYQLAEAQCAMYVIIA